MAGRIIRSVTIKIPLPVLSLLVFTAHVKTIALISKEKLMAAVSKDLFCIITSRKYANDVEGAFHK
jgi:hypothetical protein